jgi:release factor glutamine methyltransferase
MATEVPFWGLALTVRPGEVMTPRPATEALVARALARLGSEPARVADVGTGSGAVAVALAVSAPALEVWATDASREAVELARENAARHGVSDRVHAVVGDLLGPVEGTLDLVVANLPYIPALQRGSPGQEILLPEPRDAVYAAGDGLGPYRRLLAQAESQLAPHGAVLLQLHREVVEAERAELGELSTRLSELAATLSSA